MRKLRKLSTTRASRVTCLEIHCKTRRSALSSPFTRALQQEQWFTRNDIFQPPINSVCTMYKWEWARLSPERSARSAGRMVLFISRSEWILPAEQISLLQELRNYYLCRMRFMLKPQETQAADQQGQPVQQVRQE